MNEFGTDFVIDDVLEIRFNIKIPSVLDRIIIRTEINDMINLDLLDLNEKQIHYLKSIYEDDLYMYDGALPFPPFEEWCTNIIIGKYWETIKNM